MHSKVWGRYGWYVLHSTAYMYNESKIDFYKELHTVYGIILPCPICRMHFIKQVNRMGDKIMTDKELYINWLIDAHNNVNRLHSRGNWNRGQVDKLYHRDGKLNIDMTQYIIFGQFILAEAIKRGSNTNDFLKFFNLLPKLVKLDREWEEIDNLGDAYKWGYYFTNVSKERFDQVVDDTVKTFTDTLNRLPTAYEIYEWVTKSVLNKDWFGALKTRLDKDPTNLVTQVIRHGYQMFLHREPDEEGFKTYFNNIISGRMSVKNFYKSLATSPEARSLVN